MSKITYPDFCTTLSDKNAYRVAKKNNWHPYVHSIADIRAIQNGCTFDLTAAQKVEQFFLLLRHSKGEWAGQPFILQTWQRDRIIYPLFGWRRADGTRRYRRGLIFIAKKNGKSALASGISLYLLVGDDEPGAEIYSAGVDRSNALNVFTEAMTMVKASPLLLKRLQLLPGIKRINYLSQNAWYQTLSADAATAEGKNIHGLIYDEIHAVVGRALYRALMGGGAGRRQPLMLAITTAGQNAEGTLCHEEYTHAKQVLAGDITDESYFAFIAEGDHSLEPGDPANWKLANPGLGVSPKLEALQDLWQNAQGSPEKINDFKQYHLNWFVQRAQNAIPLEIWDKGATEEKLFDPDELLGRPFYGGIDLGSISDLTCFLQLFPMDDGSFRLIPHFWCPEDRSRDRGQKKVSYLKWIEEGLMIATPGNVTDYKLVRAGINSICSRYEPKTIGLDHQFQGLQLATDLVEDGLPLFVYNNSPALIGPPTRLFMELVIAGKLHHNANPILRWMAGNLVMKKVKDDLLPDKAKSHEKIDGVSGTIMALGVMNADSKQSVYNDLDHDLLILGAPEPRPEETEKTPPPPPALPPGLVRRKIIRRVLVTR